MQTRFIDFLEKKYGREITNKLVKDDCLHTDPVLEGGTDLVQDQVRALKDRIGLGFVADIDKGWAFDFPGWIGKFSPRKYMVIGMEPHIERYDFQITYGLSEYTPQKEKRFSIDTTRQSFVVCRDDSSIIWSNLFKLFADEETKAAVLEGDMTALMNFLRQFYITDLCHFAPRGPAKRIREIPQWTKWRRHIAREFLPQDIELVNPEVIITQGNTVFGELARSLKPRITGEEKCGKIKIIFAEFEGVKIISIPHFGSELTNKTFWLRNLEVVKEILARRF